MTMLPPAPEFDQDNVLSCDRCGQWMIPNISTGDEEGYGWICTSEDCPDFNGYELETEDLILCGVPAWVAIRIAALVERIDY